MIDRVTNANRSVQITVKNLTEIFLTDFNFVLNQSTDAINTKLRPGNNAAIGGLKVVTENGWFAARPSGTEDIYKIYLESFKGEEHLALLEKEAKKLVDSVIS